ncbi:MAG: nucleotide pyrophosphohydrolase [Candidatus Saccharibacteria bacterium]|nr:nucleotide pyrophosphohydrolase [Candidatus Saccharibacteria bacterium]
MDTELQRVIRFIEERDWSQFHNPKDLAISLSLEAAELLEHFQWKNQSEIDTYLQEHKADVAEELVDVLYWVLLISHYLKIDLPEAFDHKMTKNEAKYPVDKAKGKHDKYTAYE